MQLVPVPENNTRIGFHYYPDTDHYRETDLRTWLPELKALGASWLTIKAPTSHAIPEGFINGLTSNGIEPILSFEKRIPLDGSNDLRVLWDSYARWGVHYVVLFAYPNLRQSWILNHWVQSDLVERFLDIYTKQAEIIQSYGMNPVFPPLQPGGDYWDLSFLRHSLQGLLRRKEKSILSKLVIGVEANSGDHPLSWGVGGPEHWTNARPYQNIPGEENHLGFRIFDWINAITRAELGTNSPLMLFKLGRFHNSSQMDIPTQTGKYWDAVDENLVLYQMLTEQSNVQVGKSLSPSTGRSSQRIPENVISGNFWLLSTSEFSQHRNIAWFRSPNKPLPIVGKAKEFMDVKLAPSQKPFSDPKKNGEIPFHPIHYYLLLPSIGWDSAELQYETIKPIVKKYKATVGFSIDEAKISQNVFILDDTQSFLEKQIDELKNIGCKVEFVDRDGTIIAYP